MVAAIDASTEEEWSSTEPNIIKVGDFNSTLSSIDRLSR
jgi:hypothetical protein